MGEKSEAQLKNEAEVKRILAERGYSSANNKKKVNKAFGRSFSLKPFFIGLFLIAIIIYGALLLRDNPFFDNGQSRQSNIATNVTIDQEYSDFQACLGSINNSDISIDDSEFWQKYIARYEQTIACYDRYSSVASSIEKSNLQEKLAEFRQNSAQAELNNEEYRRAVAESEREYQESIAKSQAEYERRKVEIDAESIKKSEERSAQRAELERQIAETEAEIERQRQQITASEARRQQEEQNTKAKCDNYLAIYGDRTAAELAEEDPEVRSAKNVLNQKSKAYTSAYNSLYKSNVVLTESQRAPLREKYNSAKAELDSAEYSYKTLLNQKTTYYSNLKYNACGY